MTTRACIDKNGVTWRYSAIALDASRTMAEAMPSIRRPAPGCMRPACNARRMPATAAEVANDVIRSSPRNGRLSEVLPCAHGFHLLVRDRQCRVGGVSAASRIAPYVWQSDGQEYYALIKLLGDPPAYNDTLKVLWR